MQAISGFLWGIIFELPAVVPVPGVDGLVSLGYLIWGPIAAMFIFLSVLVLFRVNIDPDFETIKADYQDLDSEIQSIIDE